MSTDRKLLRSSDLEAVLRPVEQAHNLPGAVYSAGEIFDLERREIFARRWLCVGREEDVPETGDYFTLDVFGENVLVTRAVEGDVRAFYNVCRHRGACLVEQDYGRGARHFRCSYHAWAYDPSGRLVAAPLMEERPDFRREDYPLRAVRLETWEGFLFLNLDPDAPTLGESMADFPDVAAYGLGGMRRGHRIEYDIEANWKVVCENFSECYHCALVHPQLNRVSDWRSGGARLEGRSFNGGPMALNDGVATMSMGGGSKLPRIAGLEQERQVQYFTLYPHVLLALMPDYAAVYQLWPRGPGRTRLLCDFLFPEATLRSPEFDAADILEFWDLTNRQDWDLCEKVQRVAASRGSRPGPYHPAEGCVHAFDRWWVRTLQPWLLEMAD